MMTLDSTQTQGRTTKKATNLTLNIEVLAEAKKLGINISKACDAFLESLVKQEKERRWNAENIEFINEYNQITESEGLPLEKWRTF
ncbi:type II toxin-antitoxin system CcdA family antitoxin [Polynucleobacter sp. MWH-P3-07-1]|uniref:type II toxin-antitoxin system CcdA family antitoxin n=1 Tax=Polynucleobacter sp. MWH-P3-07-1 TaxID=1743173 RepID=UPI00203F93D6|nr:type II toxin-antitoxin system CcdA family antitoxin [Polynucleobacter sp. MWH-P3-07-1]